VAAINREMLGRGTKMIQEYYRQMRKFGCNILAVIQQYDIIKESAVRGAMIGNSKMLTTVGLNKVDWYLYVEVNQR
jgi:hypothetical protein